jgi:hypothetical protein
VLRETTSRGLCGLVCPSRTSERGREGDCVKEGGGEEGKCERERALERLRYDPQRCRFESVAPVQSVMGVVVYYCSTSYKAVRVEEECSGGVWRCVEG